jgi:hypothetical protein
MSLRSPASLAGPGLMSRVTRTVTQASAATDGSDRVLTSAQAAQLLQVSVDTLLQLDVPYFTVGAGRVRPRRRYLASALIEWAKRRQATAWRRGRP